MSEQIVFDVAQCGNYRTCGTAGAAAAYIAAAPALLRRSEHQRPQGTPPPTEYLEARAELKETP